MSGRRLNDTHLSNDIISLGDYSIGINISVRL